MPRAIDNSTRDNDNRSPTTTQKGSKENLSTIGHPKMLWEWVSEVSHSLPDQNQLGSLVQAETRAQGRTGTRKGETT